MTYIHGYTSGVLLDDVVDELTKGTETCCTLVVLNVFFLYFLLFTRSELEFKRMKKYEKT